MKEELLRLAERFEEKARRSRKQECGFPYHAYWRGYAEACDEAVSALRASVKEQNNGN